MAKKKYNQGLKKRCKHDKQKRYCRICNPQYFCIHGRQKYVCKDCKTGYCLHEKVKSHCIVCSPDKFCSHKKLYTECRECGGGSYCKHNKIRHNCDDCGKGVPKCNHGMRKRNCKICGNKCKHGKLMSDVCKICKRGTCPCHNKRICKDHNPNAHYASLIRSRMAKIWKRNKFTKSKKTFELLGCDMTTFRAHIELQFTDGMTWDNHGHGFGKWNFDHVVPLLYGDPDQKTMEERMHYTNLQPLWYKDNVTKGNRYVG